MVSSDITSAKEPILNSSLLNSDPFKFSIFNQEKEKLEVKPKVRGNNIENGNLILFVTNIQSKTFKSFIESIISIGKISNIKVALDLLGQRTKIKKNDKGHLLIYFTIPTSYRFKILYSPNINIFSRSQFPRNFNWYNKDRSFNIISRNLNAIGLGVNGLQQLENLLLNSVD
jgi:hypothetical protein